MQNVCEKNNNTNNSNASNSYYGRDNGIITCISPKTPFGGLARINEVKEVLIHKDYILSTVTNTVVNLANSADPDETQLIAASHLGLRYYFVNAHFFLIFLIFFINVPKITYMGIRPATPL